MIGRWLVVVGAVIIGLVAIAAVAFVVVGIPLWLLLSMTEAL